MLAVYVELTVELAPEEVEVHADVPRSGALPAQRGVAVARHRSGELAGHRVGRRADVHQRLEGGRFVHVSVVSVGEAQGQAVDPVHLLHECLVGDLPAGAHRPERGVAVGRVVGDEVRGIGTHASRHGVSAVVGVRCVAEGREVAVRGVRERVLITQCEVVSLPVRELVNARSADAVGEVADAERLVVVSVGAGISERLVAAVDRLDTGDHGHGVLFGERVVEVQLVADCEHVVAGAALVEEPSGGEVGRHLVGLLVPRGGAVHAVAYRVGVLVVVVVRVGLDHLILDARVEGQPLPELEGQAGLYAGVGRRRGQLAVVHLLQGVPAPVLIGELAFGNVALHVVEADAV